MEKTENKSMTLRHPVIAPDGSEDTVAEHATASRTEYLDGSWSEWRRGVSTFRWRGMRVNLREDGDWETVETQPRRLIRQR